MSYKTPQTPKAITPDRYAVFGNPIHHSKSPSLQMAFAKQTLQRITYTAECVDTHQFSETATRFFDQGGKGLNITVPFKVDAFHFADQLSIRAQKAGAVNTLIKKDGYILGDNTDGIGFIHDAQINLHWSFQQKRVLILGAGGAVRGIIGPLLHTQPASITIANRTLEKAEQLANDFNQDDTLSACHYTNLLEASLAPYDIVINGTSASLSGDLPNLPPSIIHTASCCYDMMYAKNPTVFMQWAKNNHAASIADGLGMLVCQGAESFYLWRHIRPNTQAVIQS
jgi:shikimate dehydrogenase